MSYFQKRQVFRYLQTVFPPPRKPWAAQGKGPAAGYLDLPTRKAEVSKADPPNLVAIPAPLHYRSEQPRQVAPSRSWASARCSGVCKATQTGHGCTGTAKAEIGIRVPSTGTAMLDPSHHSLKAKIPCGKWTTGSPHYLLVFSFMALSSPCTQ